MSVLILLLFTLYSAPISLLSNSLDIVSNIKRNVRLIRTQNSSMKANIDFVKKNTVPKERIFIVSQDNDGTLYAESGTASAPDLPSSTDYFTVQEEDYIYNFLANNVSTKVFYDPRYPLRLDPKINQILEADYRISKAGAGGLELLVKK
jgi:hypothetical protein